jgi:hypothetical protein
MEEFLENGGFKSIKSDKISGVGIASASSHKPNELPLFLRQQNGDLAMLNGLGVMPRERQFEIIAGKVLKVDTPKHRQIEYSIAVAQEHASKLNRRWWEVAKKLIDWKEYLGDENEQSAITFAERMNQTKNVNDLKKAILCHGPKELDMVQEVSGKFEVTLRFATFRLYEVFSLCSFLFVFLVS